MAAIHSKDTKPELILREALTTRGYKFETNFGADKIDIAFPVERIAVFVDGCFWHGCPLHSHKITSNESYWQTKLNRNKERDEQKTKKLESQEWIVMRFWEHELSEVDQVACKIQKALRGKQQRAHNPQARK